MCIVLDGKHSDSISIAFDAHLVCLSTGRAGKSGLAITLFSQKDKHLAGALINVLKKADQKVPPELLKFGGTVKKKQHEAYGNFYKDPNEMKQATKITFDD